MDFGSDFNFNVLGKNNVPLTGKWSFEVEGVSNLKNKNNIGFQGSINTSIMGCNLFIHMSYNH